MYIPHTVPLLRKRKHLKIEKQACRHSELFCIRGCIEWDLNTWFLAYMYILISDVQIPEENCVLIVMKAVELWEASGCLLLPTLHTAPSHSNDWHYRHVHIIYMYTCVVECVVSSIHIFCMLISYTIRHKNGNMHSTCSKWSTSKVLVFSLVSCHQSPVLHQL